MRSAPKVHADDEPAKVEPLLDGADFKARIHGNRVRPSAGSGSAQEAQAGRVAPGVGPASGEPPSDPQLRLAGAHDRGARRAAFLIARYYVLERQSFYQLLLDRRSRDVYILNVGVDA